MRSRLRQHGHLWRRPLALGATAAVAAAAFSACGGADEGSEPQGRKAAGQERAQYDRAPGSGDRPQGRPSDYIVPGGDNSIQKFGEEAPPSARERAAAVLRGFLRARAEGDWPTACSLMADSAKRQLEQLAAKTRKSSGCAEILAALGGSLPAAAKTALAKADVGSLRVEGDRAFALYDGAEGVDYFMPMASHEGQWKVAALSAVPLS